MAADPKPCGPLCAACKEIGVDQVKLVISGEDRA